MPVRLSQEGAKRLIAGAPGNFCRPLPASTPVAAPEEDRRKTALGGTYASIRGATMDTASRKHGGAIIVTVEPNQWLSLLEIPIGERIGAAPKELIDFIARVNSATGVADSARAPVAVAAEFRADVRSAIEDIPDAVKQLLVNKLLGVYFVHGVGASAVTDVVLGPRGEPLGAVIAMDPDAFMHRSANDWISWKENTPFLPSPSIKLDARIAEPGRDGRRAAIQFLLLHEFGHVASLGEAAVPDWWLDPQHLQATDNYSFLAIDWQVVERDGRRTVLPRPDKDFARRERVTYYSESRLSADDIVPVYEALQNTSFATLYSATGVQDDFAESFATYVHTEMMDRPYEVSIHHNGKEVMRTGGFWSRPCSEEKRRYMQRFLAVDQPRRAESQPGPASRIESPAGDDDGAASAVLPARDADHAPTRFIGLAPFLRLNVGGVDLLPIAQEMLAAAQLRSDDANLWMNLATALLCVGQRDIALAVQGQALEMQRHYYLDALRQPPTLKLLVLAMPGDLSANAPLDCLLEDCDIDLLFCYLSAAQTGLPPLPEHDALFVAISICDESVALLAMLERELSAWPRPVLNRPACIPALDRDAASMLLHGGPGICMPPTLRVTRVALENVAQAGTRAPVDGCRYPLIVRPVGSHAGRDLEKLDTPEAVTAYLTRIKGAEFFVSSFVDYSDTDGLFRKFRIVLVEGEAFACHMAVSAHWMVHYVNADMYQDATRRDEEAAFMADFDAFVRRHQAALQAIFARTQIDYLGIDCAETRDGDLLVFEIDHAMVVHAMDPEDMFPYKQPHMHRIRNAFRNMLLRRVSGSTDQ